MHVSVVWLFEHLILIMLFFLYMKIQFKRDVAIVPTKIMRLLGLART